MKKSSGVSGSGVLDLILGVFIVMILLSSLAGTLLAAAGNLSVSGLPLATLFGGGGALLTIIMIVIFVKLVKQHKGGM